jgi:signal-transduction protein with cAMP-binding, CBS, and nucleotidyltransferase domain
MKAVDAICRSGVAVTLDDTIKTAAGVMEHAGVGALAVVDGDRLVGIVTDRDLVRRVIARGASIDGRIDGVMTSPVVTVEADADLHSVFAILRRNAVRRIPVVRADKFVGMITTDDLVIRLAGELADLARPITAEGLFAHRDAAVPATRVRNDRTAKP